MVTVFEEPYRQHSIAIDRWPNGLFAYRVSRDGVQVAISAGNYISLSIAVQAAVNDIDRVIDLPIEAARIAEALAQREQQLENTNATAD